MIEMCVCNVCTVWQLRVVVMYWCVVCGHSTASHRTISSPASSLTWATTLAVTPHPPPPQDLVPLSLSLSLSRLTRSQLLPGLVVVALKPQCEVWWWWGHRPTIGLSCGSLSYHWWQDRGCLVKMLGAMSYCLILYTYIIYIRS